MNKIDNKVYAAIRAKRYAVEEVADYMGISKSALYRKFKIDAFSIDDAKMISRFLNLSNKEIVDIFFK